MGPISAEQTRLTHTRTQMQRRHTRTHAHPHTLRHNNKSVNAYLFASRSQKCACIIYEGKAHDDAGSELSWVAGKSSINILKCELNLLYIRIYIYVQI